MSNNRRVSTNTRIEVIRTEQKNMLTILEEVKENTRDLPVVRNNVKWLINWHNKIVMGIIFAIIIGGIALAFQVK